MRFAREIRERPRVQKRTRRGRSLGPEGARGVVSWRRRARGAISLSCLPSMIALRRRLSEVVSGGDSSSAWQNLVRRYSVRSWSATTARMTASGCDNSACAGIPNRRSSGSNTISIASTAAAAQAGKVASLQVAGVVASVRTVGRRS
jgi:hypothetical protein